MNTTDKQFDTLTELVRQHSKSFNAATEGFDNNYLYALEKDFQEKYPSIKLAMEENFIDKVNAKIASKASDWTISLDSAVLNGAVSGLSEKAAEKRIKDLSKLKGLLSSTDFDKLNDTTFKVSSKFKATGNTLADFQKALGNATELANSNSKLIVEMEKSLDGLLELSRKIFSNPDYEEADHYDTIDKFNKTIEDALKRCYRDGTITDEATFFHTNLNVSPKFGAVSKPDKEKHRYSIKYKSYGDDGVNTSIDISGKELKKIAYLISKEPVFSKIKPLASKIKDLEKDFHKLATLYNFSSLYKIYKLGKFYRSMVYLGVFSALAAITPLMILYKFESDVIESVIKAID